MWVILIIFLYIVIAELYVFLLSRGVTQADYDVILLLGCNGSATSPITKDRVDKTLAAKKRWPQARLLISGNEKGRGEISVFKSLLGSAVESNIQEELLSQDTWDNMVNSKKLLSGAERLVVVTSMFHQKRSLAFARSLHLRADGFYFPERQYKKSALYFIKERLSIYLNFPRMIWAKLITKT